jgi:hypothetical protein
MKNTTTTMPKIVIAEITSRLLKYLHMFERLGGEAGSAPASPRSGRDQQLSVLVV